MTQIALEKRLNEIRRLEGVKDDLLEALEKLRGEADNITTFNWRATGEEISRLARKAIDAANASHPA